MPKSRVWGGALKENRFHHKIFLSDERRCKPERLKTVIRYCARVVCIIPGGNSALMLVYVRLRHVAGTQWGNGMYMNVKHLESAVACWLHSWQGLQTSLQKTC